MTTRKTSTKRGTSKRGSTTKTTEPAAPRADVYERVTTRIIEQLETGTRPWIRPWNVKTTPLSRPLRHNGEPYRGINTLLLWMEAQTSGFGSNYWMTYKQAQELGGQVRKGEKAATVTYAGAIERTEENEQGEEEESRIPFLKSYFVFNADQIDNLPERFRPVPIEDVHPMTEKLRVELADDFFKYTGADIRYGGDRAFYQPAGDFVQIPMWEDFHTAEGFCSTMAHELVHWSGHKSRLNREILNAFGSADYAREELVAELGACFICADLGIFVEPREDHAAYLASWLKVLKEDKRAIFRAAAAAEKAAAFLHKLQPFGHHIPAEILLSSAA